MLLPTTPFMFALITVFLKAFPSTVHLHSLFHLLWLIRLLRTACGRVQALFYWHLRRPFVSSVGRVRGGTNYTSKGVICSLLITQGSPVTWQNSRHSFPHFHPEQRSTHQPNAKTPGSPRDVRWDGVIHQLCDWLCCLNWQYHTGIQHIPV